MPTSRAIVATASASRYLQQLCKHWSHKFDVKFDASHGHISLPIGTIGLAVCAEALLVECAVPAGCDVVRLEEVVAAHLRRFSFREGELVFAWASA